MECNRERGVGRRGARIKRVDRKRGRKIEEDKRWDKKRGVGMT